MEFDLSQVQRFIPTANRCGVDAIVTDPNNTTRVATMSICTTFGGLQMREFILKALEYYRQHAILEAKSDSITVSH